MEARLSRTADRGPLLLTLGAAGATLLVMLVVLGAPAVGACKGDGRGLVACLRDMIDHRFSIRGEADRGAQPAPGDPPAAPVVVDKPAPKLPLAGPTTAAEAPATPATTGSWGVAPALAREPEPVMVPAAATEAEPAAPSPVAEVAAPAFAPPPPIAKVEGGPPDLMAPVATEPAPSFIPPVPVVKIEGVPPDLQVASTAAAPPLEPPSDLVPPVAPELPTPPPPDLAVAATQPVVPLVEVPAAAPIVIAPTIDAVEIDGDSSSIAGTGPSGANMRLYVDGIPAGFSPVEQGRWRVEGDGLLSEPRQTLRVEALDPVTGRKIGEATLVFERPTGTAAAAPAEAPMTAPTEPKELPPIERVKPSVASDSVIILPHADGSSITRLPRASAGR